MEVLSRLNNGVDFVVFKKENAYIVHQSTEIHKLPPAFLWGRAEADFNFRMMLATEGFPPLPCTAFHSSLLSWLASSNVTSSLKQRERERESCIKERGTMLVKEKCLNGFLWTRWTSPQGCQYVCLCSRGGWCYEMWWCHPAVSSLDLLFKLAKPCCEVRTVNL